MLMILNHTQSIPEHDNTDDRDEGQTIIFGGIVTENGAKIPLTPGSG
jgi:hypothetical protein